MPGGGDDVSGTAGCCVKGYDTIDEVTRAVLGRVHDGVLFLTIHIVCFSVQLEYQFDFFSLEVTC